ncbi:MAG: bifunctional nuclease family protein [Chthonomonadales bacterium]
MESDSKEYYSEGDPRDDLRLPKFGPDGEIGDVPVPRVVVEREVVVAGVFERTSFDGSDAQTFVLLEDRNGRKVCIFIGQFEAVSLHQHLEEKKSERPHTYELFVQMMERLGARVDRVIIDDVFQETFYAKMVVQVGDHSMDIDCRPSDAVNLALRMKAPIFMAEDVIDSSEVDI